MAVLGLSAPASWGDLLKVPMDAIRAAIPANVRLAASTLVGDRSPITNENFSPSELSQIQALVTGDQQKLPARAAQNAQDAAAQDGLSKNILKKLNWISNNKDRADAYLKDPKSKDSEAFIHLGMGLYKNADDALEKTQRDYADTTADKAKATARANRAASGQGAITYQPDPLTSSGYKYRDTQEEVRDHRPNLGLDAGTRDGNAIANTLGQFTYKTQPDGSVVIDDDYDWGQVMNRYPKQQKSVLNLGPAARAGYALNGLAHGDLEAPFQAQMPTKGSGRHTHIVLPPPKRP